MALIKCKDCKNPVSTRAKACPHCGAEPARTSGCAMLVLILFVVFVGLPLMAQLLKGDRGPSSPGPQSTGSKNAVASERQGQPPSGYQSKADSSVVPRAKRAVAQQLKDPESVQFKDVSFAWSERTGNVAYGWVNSKNGLGGYTGFQRFVANETTVLLEEREEERTLAAWRDAAGGRSTEESLARLPQGGGAAVPLIFDVKSVIAKTPAEVVKLLGKPKETGKSKYGTTYTYETPDLEILFMSGKANMITVNGLDSVPFTPAAIQALGLPVKSPTFANDKIMMRWESVAVDKFPLIKRVQISRGRDNCDFATVSVDGWPDEK